MERLKNQLPMVRGEIKKQEEHTPMTTLKNDLTKPVFVLSKLLHKLSQTIILKPGFSLCPSLIAIVIFSFLFF